MDQPLKMKIPVALAVELQSEGLASPQPTARSTAWELVWTGASSASVVVTLLQGPGLVHKLATACIRLINKQDDDAESASPSIEATGPGGQLRIPVKPETDLHEVERFLEKVLFAKQDGSDDQ